MFEHMKIAESIYEGALPHSCKITTREEANRNGISRNKRREYASPNTHPAKDDSARNPSKQYVDRSKSTLKHCMMYCLGHSYD